jgi:archaetidylinositol phosphate synthase
MLESVVRKYLQPVFNFLARFLARYFSANNITFLALATGLSAGMAIAFGCQYLAVVFLALSALFDILDGSVARLTKSSSTKGCYLDLISDRVVESALMIGFYFWMPQNALAYLLFFAGLIFHFSTFIAAGSLFENNTEKSFYYDITLVERAEAFIIFFLMILLPAYAFNLLMILNIGIFISALGRVFRILYI